MKKTVRRIVIGVILLCLCAAGYMIWQVMDIYPEGYTAEQLGIEELYSMRDENGNGTDDYHDFVAGARLCGKRPALSEHILCGRLSG